jgi:hypothetical protein
MSIDEWTIKVHGYKNPGPLIGYQQLELPVAWGDQDARWVSIAGIAELDTKDNVDYWPSGQPDLNAVGYRSPGSIYIVTPLVLANDDALITWVVSVGVAGYDIDEAQGDWGWAINFTDVRLRRSVEAEDDGRAEIIIGNPVQDQPPGAYYKGDWGLNRIGFKADLLIREGSLP